MKITLIILCIFSNLSCFSQYWFDLGDGITGGGNSGVHMVTFDNKLFVCGAIYSIDNDIDIRGVGVWDGNEWSGIDNPGPPFWFVHALVEYNNELYAFAHYHNDQFGELIKYNKIENSWNAVPNSKVSRIGDEGNIHSGIVYKAIVYDDGLYVAGEFDSIGNVSTKSLAKWNGIEWFPVLDDNGDFIQMESISDLEVYKNELYVCASFDSLNGEEHNGIARWNGQSWDNVNGGLLNINPGIPVHINDLEVYDGDLYAGTTKLRISGNDQIYYLFRWNGNNWNGIDVFEQDNISGIFSVNALGKFGDFLVVGTNTRAKTYLYNGYDVIGIEQEFNLRITDYEVYKQQLYVSGYFYGHDSPEHIARLGATHEHLDSQINCTIFPNPTNGYFYLDYELLKNSSITIKIFDISGKSLYDEAFDDLKGKHLRSIDTKDWPAGCYIVSFKSDEFNEVKVLTKIRN